MLTQDAPMSGAAGAAVVVEGRLDLSIIVVNWNTRELLRDCLASVFENADAEVLVVDNASEDGSVEMVEREFPRVRLIRNAENLGFAAANNQAIRVARGRYVLLLNSDTVVLGDALSRSVDYMDEHPEAGVFGCRVLNPDRTLQLTCSQVPSLVNLMLLTTGLWRLDRPQWCGRYQMKHWRRNSERDVEVVSGCFMLVRCKAIESVGLLDESFFFFGEETDWCARFRKAGWKVRFAPVGEIIHYGSASAASLGHDRDLLLTSSLIRYHVKHSGFLAALFVWGLLLGFNMSRCAFWWIRTLVRPSKMSVDRHEHFKDIVSAYGKAWPTRHEMND